MQKLITVGLAGLLTLAGCTNYPLPTPEEYAAVRARNTRFEEDKPKLSDALSRSAASCHSDSSCAKAWRMTKNFVEMYSAGGLRRYDDTRIATNANYRIPGFISLSATRMDTKNGAQIYLHVQCTGMYGVNSTVPGDSYTTCADHIFSLYDLFVYQVTSQID